MNRLDPETLFHLALAVGLVHLGCAMAVGRSGFLRGPGPGWPKARLGLRSNSLAGLGLAVVAGVVAWRVSPGRVRVSESWLMLAGLALAVVGQAGMIRAMWAGGSTAAPAPGERTALRIYIGAAPAFVLALLALLFALRGVR